jgi:diaminohydroxyphosphoribosylaminopyrimidine deaminase/5-amino-6-(5-phosphoribosylamino)uracil reductase
MRRALALAARGAGLTSPNPMVGALVVARGRVVGEGYHHAAGLAHAEVEALDAAGPRARDATLYVTLEPCAHHGRTPPCTDKIIASGVTRVVAAMSDPDPRVEGRGFAALRRAGIEVVKDILAPEAERLNEGFVTRVRLGRPFVLLKLAMTLDGRVSVPGQRYLVGAPALRYVHRLRARADAVLVGVGTVLADDPKLTVRGVRGRDPLRIVLDTDARTPTASNVVTAPDPERTVVIVGDGADGRRTDALATAGVTVVAVPRATDGHLDLAAALGCLAARGINSVLAEGGPHVATALLRSALADELLMILPPLLGGPGPQAFGELGAAATLERITVRRLGSDLAIRAQLRRAS